MPQIDGKSAPLKSDVHFIHEGLLIRSAQCVISISLGLVIDFVLRLEIKAQVLFYKVDKSESLKAEIETARTRLHTRIDKWRATQKRMMPQVGDHVAKQNSSGKILAKPEEEQLFLPSDLSSEERHSLVPMVYSECERKLLEGHVFDVLRDLRTIVKSLDNLCAEKDQNYGQVRQTRASARIQQVIALRDSNIAEYNAARALLINLGGIEQDDELLRPLKKEDTYRKRTTVKRAVGDTYRHDGLLWANRGVTGGTQPARLSQTSAGGILTSDISTLGTQGSKPKKRQSLSFIIPTLRSHSHSM